MNALRHFLHTTQTGKDRSATVRIRAKNQIGLSFLPFYCKRGFLLKWIGTQKNYVPTL